MSEPKDPQEPETSTVSDAPDASDDGQRRLLYFLLGLLGIAAMALLALLIWLLWPDDSSPSSAAEGYPIVPVLSITGYGAKPDEMLNQPLGAEFDEDGNIWISDTGHARVLVFNDDGELLTIVGEEEGDGKLAAPNGVFVDPGTDRAYVADWVSRRIKVYTKTGDYITSLPNPKQKSELFGDGFTPYDVQVVDGRVVAVSQNGIFFFDQEGVLIDRWGKNKIGVGYTQFNFPNSLDYDPRLRRYYVTDTTNKRVMALDTEGNVLWISGTPDASGNITGFWQLPRALTIGPDGNVYVVDIFRADAVGVGDGFIVTISPDGQLVSAFGRSSSEENSFEFPEKLDYRPDGLWAIADRQQNRVLLFKLTPIPSPGPENQQKYPESFFPGPFLRAGPSPTETPVPGSTPSPGA